MTSDIAGAAARQPAPQPYDPIHAPLRAGKNDEAIVRLYAIVVTRPNDLNAKELLFDAVFQKRDWPSALALAEELARRRPDVTRRRMEDEYSGVGLFQRFLVMNDRTVGRFLVRDCDARVSAAEADLVRRRIDGGYPFHVVRDHVLHNELMIGCLWAGRTDCGIDIVALMRRYFAAGPTAKYGHDRRMLGLMLWPLIRSRCLVHDKYYRLEDVHTVPLDDPQSRFGAGFQNIATVLQEVERLGIPRVR